MLKTNTKQVSNKVKNYIIENFKDFQEFSWIFRGFLKVMDNNKVEI